MKKKIFKAGLILLSLLATFKLCILGLNIDEEYAVTMAYRMIAGDRMFLELWEPHQTSGFLTALLIRVFMFFTGGTDCLILYLRVAGAVIQAGISIFLYRTVRHLSTSDGAFVAALFFYNTLPKWIQTPEFSNMLVWFSTLAFLCYLRFYLSERKSRGWLVGAGLSLSALVLSYPSCILAVPVYLLCMGIMDRKHFIRDAAVVFSTCLAAGLLYIGYFLSHMTIQEFLHGLRQMMTDASHSASLSERLASYGQELLRLLPHAAIILAAAIAMSVIYKCFEKNRTHYIGEVQRTSSEMQAHSRFLFLTALVSCAMAEQLIVWLGIGTYIHFPLLYYYFLFAAGLLAYRWFGQPCHRPLLLMGTVTGAAVWLSGLLITNTTVSVTGSYLMSGLISAILLLFMDTIPKPKTNIPALLFTLVLLGTVLFAKGFLLCANQGYKDDVFFVKQKALSGPAKNIYCQYVEGYEYNQFAQIASTYIEPGDSVLYVGPHSLYYMLGEQTISNYSTISTPTFDERLLEYWELYPDHYPDMIVGYTDTDSLHIVEELLLLKEPVLVDEVFTVYRLHHTSISPDSLPTLQ